jgi:hypothetical protein
MRECGFIIALAVGLTGWVAVWMSGYKVERENSDAVTIKYDHHFASPSDVAMVAEAGCERFGKRALPTGGSTSIWGLTTERFACVERSWSTGR